MKRDISTESREKRATPIHSPPQLPLHPFSLSFFPHSGSVLLPTLRLPTFSLQTWAISHLCLSVQREPHTPKSESSYTETVQTVGMHGRGQNSPPPAKGRSYFSSPLPDPDSPNPGLFKHDIELGGRGWDHWLFSQLNTFHASVIWSTHLGTNCIGGGFAAAKGGRGCKVGR